MKISQYMIEDLQVLAHLAESTNTNVPFTGDRIRQIIRIILDLQGKIIDLEPQTKPLSDEEIEELEEKWEWTAEYSGIRDVIKDVEERHGIK